ncbi:bacterial translation initiation factor 3 (bIF-3) [Rubritalea squalenifaciens DSM 18772]|uniref:Translation initiation factor IF-3 n=1 Tax=Rubritalea squalenifaciens DSM 18772 TaxID=1123071 RepID=A0A1M6HN83_9BACT|nr:translation initiation factor IF-3 [Rubritalea squalenifaciens]SHJ23657.1 bacterial translation initiation factor 3 (bIF-3) [Rubritalea squalenifaciens DSM 18772]
MTRVNEYIRAPKVRVVTPNGEQLGVMSSREAVAKAKSIGLDLVEITANADPPVCKICDYGKYKYEQSKLNKGKSKATTKLKEVKFRVRTEEHDYNLKCSRIEKFLDGGNKVKVQLQFRGRENAHKELGFEVLQRVAEDLKGMGNLDQKPRLAGRAVSMLLSPLPKEQRKRKFLMDHGELVDDDDEDFDDDVIEESEEDESEE